MYTRYSDVSFLYTQLAIEEFPEFIDMLIEENLNDKMWETYLSTPIKSENFPEFKARVLEQSKPKHVVEQEAYAGMHSALDMLNGLGGGS